MVAATVGGIITRGDTRATTRGGDLEGPQVKFQSLSSASSVESGTKLTYNLNQTTGGVSGVEKILSTFVYYCQGPRDGNVASQSSWSLE